MGISQRDYILTPDSYSIPKTRFDIDFMREGERKKKEEWGRQETERERERKVSKPVEINVRGYLHANTVDKVLQNSDTLHLFQLDILLLSVARCN